MKKHSFILTVAMITALVFSVTSFIAPGEADASFYPNATPASCKGGSLSNPPAAQVGVPYSYQLKYTPECGTDGDDAEFYLISTFASTEGLPASFTLSESGLLTGTATEADIGTYSVNIYVGGGAHSHDGDIYHYYSYEDYFTLQFNIAAASGAGVPGNAPDEIIQTLPTGTELSGGEPTVAPPQTGDSNMNWLWAVAAAGTACAVAAVAMRRREN